MIRVNLKRPIKDFEGKPIFDSEGEWDYQKGFLGFIGNYQTDNKNEAIRIAFSIGPKVCNAKEDFVELEDADFQILKKAVDQNPRKWPPIIWGVYLKGLEDDEKLVAGEFIKNGLNR